MRLITTLSILTVFRPAAHFSFIRNSKRYFLDDIHHQGGDSKDKNPADVIQTINDLKLIARFIEETTNIQEHEADEVRPGKVNFSTRMT